jgi:hypothetical protein
MYRKDICLQQFISVLGTQSKIVLDEIGNNLPCPVSLREF